jgi:hypothetical protein
MGVGSQMLGGGGRKPHYGPKLSQMLRGYAERSELPILDAGTQVRYIEDTIAWRNVSHDAFIKAVGRYNSRFGPSAGKAMAMYFNPLRVTTNRLSQSVMDLWYFTIVNDLIHRGGFEAP